MYLLDQRSKDRTGLFNVGARRSTKWASVEALTKMLHQNNRR